VLEAMRFGWVEMAKCLRVGRLDFFERGKGGVGGECVGNGVGGRRGIAVGEIENARLVDGVRMCCGKAV